MIPRRNKSGHKLAWYLWGSITTTTIGRVKRDDALFQYATLPGSSMREQSTSKIDASGGGGGGKGGGGKGGGGRGEGGYWVKC